MFWKRLALGGLIVGLIYDAYRVTEVFPFPSVGWVGAFVGGSLMDFKLWPLLIAILYFWHRDGSLWNTRPTMCTVCKVQAADSKFEGSMCGECYAKAEAEAELEAARLRQ